jgi:tetratricopeptide (TPR) repeat protein
MKLFLAASAVALLAASAAHAAAPVRQMIYNVNAATQCSMAASDQADLNDGLEHCNVALRDPVISHRAALLMDRGIVQVKLGRNKAALADYNAAIAADPQLGDAYVSRAGVLISMKRYDDARSDVAQGMALNASNMQAAYYGRAVIEEESGDVQGAYRDYKQALAIKPDFAPAIRELTRFKVVQRAARL